MVPNTVLSSIKTNSHYKYDKMFNDYSTDNVLQHEQYNKFATCYNFMRENTEFVYILISWHVMYCIHQVCRKHLTSFRIHLHTNRIPTSLLSTNYYLFLLLSVLWRCWLRISRSIQSAENWVIRCRHGFVCGSRWKLFAHGPADATATLSSLASSKSRMVRLSGDDLPRLTWKRVH